MGDKGVKTTLGEGDVDGAEHGLATGARGELESAQVSRERESLYESTLLHV